MIKTLWKNYTTAMLKADLTAGLIVAVVSIPLGLAFAIASGATPIQGLITSVIAGSLVAIFGGSRFQIAGAAAALIPVLAAISLNSLNGFQDVMIAGMMAGVLLVLMGWLRFGKLIEYIPYPVVLGFTSGIAISIIATQLNNVLGLTAQDAAGAKLFSGNGLVQLLPKHEFFHQNMQETLMSLAAVNGWAILLTVITVAAILHGSKLPGLKKVPGALIGLVVGTLVAVVGGISGGNHLQPVRPGAVRTARAQPAPGQLRAYAGTGETGFHHRHSGRRRSPAVGGGGRQHEW